MTPPRNCTELLREMIRFDTVTAHHSGRALAERPLAEYLAETASAWELATTWLPVPGYAPNLLVTREIASTAPWLLFDSHLDTVGIEGMTIEPFEPQQREGRIYGRGAADTKGSGAAMLWALREMNQAKSNTANIGILFTVGEEHLQVGAGYFAEQQLTTIGWRPVGVVVGEPTGLQIVSATNGLARWTIRTRGVAAHSSAPQRGRSAIRDMMRVLEEVDTKYIDHLQATHPLTGAACCSVNVIRGGSLVNVIPDQCEADVDRRLVPGEDPAKVLPALERILDQLRLQDPQLDVELVQPVFVGPMDDAPNRRFAARVASALGYSGSAAEPAGAPYVTDGNRLAAGGIPTVVFGPGDIAQAHTDDEWIAIEQVERGVAAYRKLMQAPPDTWLDA